MSILANAALIRGFLDGMSAEGELNAESFLGDREEVLFGLREMLLLKGSLATLGMEGSRTRSAPSILSFRDLPD